MMKLKLLILAALAAVTLWGCSSSGGPPPSPHNVCAIFEDRPNWRSAVREAEARWNAPAAVQMAIIWRESSFRQTARPPKKNVLWVVPWGHVSTAYGYAQAIDGTWDWYREDTGNSGADRDDFDDAADFVGWYMAKTTASNGVPATDAYNQYLAYHEGHAGYRRGSWRQKKWLQKAASQVQAQAKKYQSQLSGCGLAS